MRKIRTSTFLLITFFPKRNNLTRGTIEFLIKFCIKHYIVNISTFFRLAKISTGLLNNLKINQNYWKPPRDLKCTFFNWKFRPYGSCDLMGRSNYWSIFEPKHPTNGKSKLYIYLHCFERVFNKLSNDTRLIDFALAVLSLLIIKGAL